MSAPRRRGLRPALGFFAATLLLAALATSALAGGDGPLATSASSSAAGGSAAAVLGAQAQPGDAAAPDAGAGALPPDGSAPDNSVAPENPTPDAVAPDAGGEATPAPDASAPDASGQDGSAAPDAQAPDAPGDATPAPGDEAAPAPGSPQDPQASGSDALVGSQLIAAAPTNEAQPASGDFEWTYTTDRMPAGQCAINGWNNVQPADGVARVPAVAPPSAGAAAGLPVVAIAEVPHVSGATTTSPYMNLSASLDFSGAANLATIGRSAFYNCTHLTGTLALPASLTTIGDSAFDSCSGLTGTLTLPASLTTIGDSAFDSCRGLTGTLTSLGYGAFFNCTGLTSLDLTGATSLTSIGVSTFNFCSGLTGPLALPASLTSIGLSAFSRCSGLSGTLTLPASLTSIGYDAFWGCSLDAVQLPSGLRSLGYGAFAGNGLWALPGLPPSCAVAAGDPPITSQIPTGTLMWTADGADNADVLLADGLAEHGIASLDEVGDVTLKDGSNNNISVLNPNTWRTDGYVKVSRASLEQGGATLNYTYRRPGAAGGYQALGDATVSSFRQRPFRWTYSTDGMPADQCKIVGWNNVQPQPGPDGSPGAAAVPAVAPDTAGAAAGRKVVAFAGAVNGTRCSQISPRDWTSRQPTTSPPSMSSPSTTARA